MELFYNYLLQGKQMSLNFDIDNRLDHDVDGCYELYKDYAALVMGTELSKYFNLEGVAKQYEETLYPNQTLRSTWEKFDKMYKGNVKYKGRGNLTASRFLIKLSDPKGTHCSYLLSTDYFGPSIASAKHHGMTEEAQRRILDRCKILGGGAYSVACTSAKYFSQCCKRWKRRLLR